MNVTTGYNHGLIVQPGDNAAFFALQGGGRQQQDRFTARGLNRTADQALGIDGLRDIGIRGTVFEGEVNALPTSSTPLAQMRYRRDSIYRVTASSMALSACSMPG